MDGLIGWRKALGQARIRRGKHRPVGRIEARQRFLSSFSEGHRVFLIAEMTYMILREEAFPRDKETCGIPDNEMYRGLQKVSSFLDLGIKQNGW